MTIVHIRQFVGGNKGPAKTEQPGSMVSIVAWVDAGPFYIYSVLKKIMQY